MRIDLDSLDFFKLGILAKFENEKGVSKKRILDATQDDNEAIMAALRFFYVQKLVAYDAEGEYFDFGNYGFGLKNRSDDSWLQPLPQGDSESEKPKKPGKQKVPRDLAEHAMQHMAGKHESLSGKIYSPYAILVHEIFNKTKGVISKEKTLALGAFLYAYERVIGQDFPIPGAYSNRKYWVKIISNHLENYTLGQLESLYIVAIRLHSQEELSIYSPESITKKLVEAYQLLAAKAKSKAKTKDKLEEAKLNPQVKSQEEIEEESIERILNFASGKSGASKNSPVMWRGYIFDSEADKQAVLSYYPNWQDKIHHDKEQEMRDDLAAGRLELGIALPMTDLTDLFHFRTAKEDKLLFQAYVFTQRATNPNLNPISLRLDKSTPLPDDLETCELPEFYRDLGDSYVTKPETLDAVLGKPVKADSIMTQFENLETLAKIGDE